MRCKKLEQGTCERFLRKFLDCVSPPLDYDCILYSSGAREFVP